MTRSAARSSCAEHPSARLALLIAALLALTLAAAMPARGADQAEGALPPNTVRIGLYALFYHVGAHDISGPYVPAGVNLDVNDVQTLYLAYVRRLWTNLDAELAFGWPPLTKTVGRGPAALGSVPYNGQVISTARWFAPTLLFNYLFFDDSHALRPYVGIGVNYTRFYDRDSTAAGNAATGGPTRLSLTASVGPAADVGISYRWASRWSAYLSYSFSDVNSDLTADTAGVIRRSHIDFRPTALVAAVGYSF